MRLTELAIRDPHGGRILMATDQYRSMFSAPAEPAYRNSGRGRPFVGFQDHGGVGPNAALLPALPMLRSRSRALIRNSGLIWNVIDTLVSDHIGWGITPAWDDEELNQRYEDWDKQVGFSAKQVHGCFEMFAAGEVFFRVRKRLSTDTDRFGRLLVVPLDVQVLEAEHCPIDHEGINPANGNIIRAGIEFNGIGQRVAYYMYRNHPGDNVPLKAVRDNELIRVPASEVLHLYVKEAPSQLRGIPRASRALLDAHKFDAMNEATLTRMVVAGLLTGFVKTSNPDDPSAILGQTAESPDPTWEPATLVKLGPDEDIQFPSLPDVGSAHADFIDGKYRQLAAALGCMFEHISLDLSNVNFTSYKAGSNVYRRRCEMLQFTTIVPELLEPVAVHWLRRGVQSGRISIPGFDEDEVKASRCAFITQGWLMTDPMREGAAAHQAIRDGLTTESEVIRERGGNPDRVRKERAKEIAARHALKEAGPDGVITDTEVPNPQASVAVDSLSADTDETPRQQKARRTGAKTRRVVHA